MTPSLAVVISDIHYSLQTLQLADTAFRSAIDKAAALGVPCIDCGDITSDKAILRAEVIKAITDTLKYAASKGVRVYCVVGNHSLWNQKGDEHALTFMEPYATVISAPCTVDGFHFIPYQKSEEAFLAAINQFPLGSIVFGHQGTKGGQLGDYIRDLTAFDPNDVADWRVFLGHYHAHYELGTTVSIGNPYTLTFGEAKDGPKGYLIVRTDGTFSRVILPLRHHIVLEYDASECGWRSIRPDILRPDDVVWVKLRGTSSELSTVTKSKVSQFLGIEAFKFDKIVTAQDDITEQYQATSGAEILDGLIDSVASTPELRAEYKALWRELVEDA